MTTTMTTTRTRWNGGTLARRGLSSLFAALVVASAAFAAPPDSGVKGVVVPRTTVLVFRAGGTELVASVRPGPLGNFRVALPPGRYLLRVNIRRPQAGPRKVTRAVIVRPHEFTSVVIRA
jgi:hypothetical protein